MFTGQQLRTTMFLLIGLLMGTFAGKVERPRYHTAYACEGNNLKISCENGQLIQLLRANYGRFSISICNEQGILNWSVKCASEKSYFVIHERCNVVPRCIVNVTSNTFGDPCPGTYKYLEVQYQCMLEFNPLSSTMLSKTTSTTTTTRPPIIIPITKPRTTTTSTTTPTPSASLGTITTTERPIPTTLLLSPSLSTLHSNSSNSTTVLEYDRKFTRSKTETTTVFYRSSSPPPPVFHNDLYCPPVIARNIIWNWTREGQIAIEKCPAGSTGYARWQCGTKPVVWLPESPDLSECQSMWVDNLHRRIEGDESIIGIATELAVITKTKPLYGGDIRQVSGITQRLVAEMAVSAKDITDSEQRYLGFPNHQQQQIAHELLELMTEISSNLLERYHHDSWRDLSLSEQRTSASALIQVLEESSWHLFESQPPISRFHTFENNLLVSVRRIQTWSTSEVRFPTFKDVEGSDWTRMEDCIVVPTQALLGVAKNGVVDIVFLAYNKLGNFLTAADRGIFRRPLLANKQSNSSHIINSRVLAASVRRHGLVNLHQPAKIVFRHIQEENVTNPRCVYWDFNNRMWSGEGCWTSSTNKTHTECSCNHFTNFALLMEASAIEQYEVFEKASKVAVWNGCTIGMAFILITFLLLIRLRRLKGDMYTIRKNILVCLFLAEIVFLIGIEQTTNRIVCGVVAGFLCYLLLEVFAWALLSVFHLFMVVVDVLDGSTSRSKWYAGFGYSIPAIVVGISAAIDPGSFGNGVNVCWLEYGNFYVMSFVGPVGASIIVSIVLLIFVYHRISQRSDSGMAGKNKEGVKNSIIRAWCTNSMCVLVVLSLTWSSCLWYLYDTSPITIYLFAVSNSLQGALLFILYCVVESQVRIAICDGIRSISWFEACVNSSKPVVSPPSQYIYTNDMMNISVSPISGHESVGNLVLPTPVSSSSAVSPAVMEISELPNRNQEFPQTRSPIYDQGEYSSR